MGWMREQGGTGRCGGDGVKARLIERRRCTRGTTEYIMWRGLSHHPPHLLPYDQAEVIGWLIALCISWFYGVWSL